MIEAESRNVSDNAAYQFDVWRSNFLRIMLWVFCGLGLILLLSVFASASTFARSIFVALYAALLAVSFLPVPYHVKTITVLVVGFGVGLYNFLNWGPWGDGIVFFLAISAIAALLLDGRAYAFVLAAAIGIILITAVLNLLGLFPLALGVPSTSAHDWLAYFLDFLVLAVPIAWGIRLFRNEFDMIADRFNTNLQLLTKDRDDLEQKVNERTYSLTKKTNQLQAGSFIARQTAQVQDLAVLLDLVAKLVSDQFGFYHTGVFLLTENGNEAMLQASSSEGGRRMLQGGHSFAVGGQSIVGYVAAEKRPRIALDMGRDAVFFNNPDLPMTRSELALPLLVRDRVLGILDIQSDKAEAFTIDDVDVLQTLADQVAVAIENTRLLDESRAALTQLEALTTIRTREAWHQKLSGKSRVFTYTPLGLRAERLPSSTDNAINIPLTLRGQKIGSISIARKGDAAIHKSDEELIAEVANQAGLAIDNIRLLEEATQRAKQEQIVGKLAGRFSQSLDIDTLLQTAARELAQLPDVSEVSVFVGKQSSEIPVTPKSKRNSG